MSQSPWTKEEVVATGNPASKENKGIKIQLEGRDKDLNDLKVDVVFPIDQNNHLGRVCYDCKREFGISVVDPRNFQSLYCPYCGNKHGFDKCSHPNQIKLMRQRMTQEEYDRKYAFQDGFATAYKQLTDRRPHSNLFYYKESAKANLYNCTHCEGKGFSTESFAKKCPYCGKYDGVQKVAQRDLIQGVDPVPQKQIETIKKLPNKNLRGFLWVLFLSFLYVSIFR